MTAEGRFREGKSNKKEKERKKCRGKKRKDILRKLRHKE
jgi:hypothetical protein